MSGSDPVATQSSWDPDEGETPKIPVTDRVGIMAEFWAFLWENKIWWMAPTVLILAALGIVLWLASGSAVAPFFYALT